MTNKILKRVFDVYAGAALSVFSRWPIGTNAFEREWDVLILLDTCRVDALKEVSSEYDFINDVGSLTSVGSTSAEWIACTFVQEYIDDIRETIYVSANGFEEKVLIQGKMPDEGRGLSWSDWSTVSGDDLLKLDPVWKYRTKELGHTRPRHVTDRAIVNARTENPDRLIVHYSHPHDPYVANAYAEDRKDLYEYEEDPWDYLKETGDFQTIWDAYIDNLRFILDEVEILLQNVDGDTVVISADHGEGFGGKWGVNHHPIAIPHPKIKRVPWAVTSATDTGSYIPSDNPDASKNVPDSVEDHLKALVFS